MNRARMVVWAVLICAVFVILFAFKRRQQDKTTPSAPVEVAVESAEQDPKIHEQTNPKSIFDSHPARTEHAVSGGAAASGVSVSPTPQDIGSNIQRAVVEHVSALVRPISFYGQVRDEQDVPVADVRVGLQCNHPTLPREETRFVIRSDESGNFALEGKAGLSLAVELSKDGYYVAKKNAVFHFIFNPAFGDGVYSPDPLRPVVFYLRRKGAGTELITSKHGVEPALNVSVNTDGTPLRVDLLRRNVDAGGQLELAQKKPDYSDWKNAAEWSVELKIPNGGLIEHNDEFPFQAPERGYQPAITFEFKKDGIWSNDLKREFYFTFGSPPRYGRLIVETSIHRREVRLQYAINPDGSRYLEPKE